MIEEYRAVKGYEGIYEVSNYGNVKSLERINLAGYRIKEKIMKGSTASKGYRKFILSKNFIKKTIEVHQLVAITFLNHVPNGHKIIVDHIDNNPLNNRLDNLQLITHRENSSKDRKGTSKYTGVSWCKPYKKWVAQININGKVKHIGRFANEIQASNAYLYELKNIQQHDRII
jgi:hypothetical protein